MQVNSSLDKVGGGKLGGSNMPYYGMRGGVGSGTRLVKKRLVRKME